MKKKGLVFIGILVGVIILSAVGQSMNYKENLVDSSKLVFIEKIAQIIEDEEIKTFKSVVLAQAILESGWGESDLTRTAYNLFGIKGDYKGQSVDVVTLEYEDGEPVEIVDQFCKYNSYHESVRDHQDLMQSKYYRQVREAETYEEATYWLKELGYATDPAYDAKLNQIIADYQLYLYDVKQ